MKNSDTISIKWAGISVTRNSQVRGQIFAVTGDRLAIHSRGTVPADSPVGFPQPELIQMLAQRGERAARVFLSRCCDVLLTS